MNITEMQTVSQYRHCRFSNGNFYNSKISYEGVFHCFGPAKVNGIIVIVAIVESNTGTIHFINPTAVKFDEYYKTELARSIEEWSKEKL